MCACVFMMTAYHTHIMSCTRAVFLSSREDIWCYQRAMTVLLRTVYVLENEDSGSVAVMRVFLQFQNGFRLDCPP